MLSCSTKPAMSLPNTAMTVPLTDTKWSSIGDSHVLHAPFSPVVARRFMMAGTGVNSASTSDRSVLSVAS